MMRASPVIPTVDFYADGVQHGFLKLPHSHDESAWGSIMTPITVIKNAEGPTALLSGGNHGDEYEGPISLYKLSHSLQAEEITGRVIIVPAMNYPAFLAGKRTSPIDGRNMNRIFPGSPDGTVTEKMADFFYRNLLGLADFVLDIHSGGRTLDFVPFAAVHRLEDKNLERRAIAAMEAFCAPYSMKLVELDAVGMYDTAAETMGKVFLSTELGGGGTSSAQTVGVADRGVRNFLKHAGILGGEIEQQKSVNLDMPDGDCYILSEDSGLVEFCVDLGANVKKGDTLVKVYNVNHSGRAPAIYRAKRDGMLAGRHFPGMVGMGDCLCVIGVRDESA